MHPVQETRIRPGMNSEAQGPVRDSTKLLWAQGKLHPAPLSRKAVEAIQAMVG